MARYSNGELDRLKAGISLVKQVEISGVKLEKKGKDLLGLCPFHPDKNPSLSVNEEKGSWHCFGCGAGGSVIDWVMKERGVSFRLAVEILHKQQSGADIPSSKTTQAKLPSDFDFDVEDQVLLKQVLDYYTETLKRNPEALQYLEKRGLKSSEMIDQFRLGYANRTLGYRLPPMVNKEGKKIRARLQRLGILRKSGHEHFRGSLIIPVFDENRAVTEIYGRKTSQRLRKGTALHLYLPGPHKGIFNLEALSASQEIILCESLIDALTFWCAGFRNVTASYGINGFTEDHWMAFKRHGIKKVLIAYDRDEGGEQAARTLSKSLLDEGFGCYRIQFPKGMDANEYSLALKPAHESLGLVIRKAVWLGKGKSKEPEQIAAAKTPQAEPRAETPKEEPAPSLTSSLAAPMPVNASPEPPAPKSDLDVVRKSEEVIIRLGDRRYRIRGLAKNMSYDQLKINLLVSKGESFHVDTFDLYAHRQRSFFIKQAAEELMIKDAVIKKDLGRVLLKLEEIQDERIQEALSPKEEIIEISEEEKNEALVFLRDPRLLRRIVSDFEACGVVGEEVNKLVGYLAGISRKLERPLAVLIQSSSAAGKSSLLEAILSFIPEEDQTKFSAMTGQSLFYMGEADLKHRVLAVIEEEGAERASYPLKLLHSEGELSIASTGKDPQTGRLITQEYRVEGPVSLLLTTTSIDIDEELRNRCLVLSVNEDRDQTKAIHDIQRERETLEGLLTNREHKHILNLHRNAQRLLKPIPVVNPFAKDLTFIDDRTRARRDHMKYLTLIRSIALIHQYQRPKKSVTKNGEKIEYIEVTLDDIETANKLAHEVMGRSIDELPPQTRKLSTLLTKMVFEACERLEMDVSDFRFSRRDVREYSGWTDYQIKTHMRKLEDLEYVLAYRGSRGQSFVYELLYQGEGQDGQPFLMGLIDVKKLRAKYDNKWEGSKTEKEHWIGEKEGRSSSEVGPKSGPSSPPNFGSEVSHYQQSKRITEQSSQKRHRRGEESDESYFHPRRNGALAGSLGKTELRG